MTTQEINQARAQAFSQRMLGMLNDAALTLMTAIGHQTGLFDAMAALPPATTDTIASAASLNERYMQGVAGSDG